MSVMLGRTERGHRGWAWAGAAVVVVAVAGVVQAAEARPAGKHTVGIYADFTTDGAVSTVLREGWHLIASVAGLGRSDCSAPYTYSQGTDAHVARVLDSYERRHPNAVHPAWLSYWTLDSPPAGSLTAIRAAGRSAGRYAGAEINRVTAGKVTHPWWAVLDPEGYSCRGGGFDAMSPAQFRQFVGGWEDGLRASTTLAAPALYVNQSQYQSLGAATFRLPVFVAVVLPHRSPVKGRNIEGYAAYYANCGNARPDINQVRSWGAAYNSVQFPNSAICRP